MVTEIINPGYSETESFRVVSSFHRKYDDLVGQQTRGRSAHRQTSLWLLFSAFALIFLVLKCTMQLAIGTRPSTRMLAEGGKWPGETQKALLDHGSGEEIEMQCLGASSAEETTESEQEGNKSLWSTLWSGKSSSMQHPPAAEGNREEEEEEKDTFLGPSTSSGSASSQDSARHRVEHKTHLFLGYSRSPHYERPNEYYGFPRIGGENEQLRDALTSLQDFAWDLCLAHTEPSTRVFQAEVLLKNCSGIAVVHIRVEEQPFGSRGPLDFLVGEVQSLWRGVDHRHFRRDVACVVEEMLVKVLAEAEESGDQETTRLWSLIEKPKGVGTTGKVLLEVHATRK